MQSTKQPAAEQREVLLERCEPLIPQRLELPSRHPGRKTVGRRPLSERACFAEQEYSKGYLTHVRTVISLVS